MYVDSDALLVALKADDRMRPLAKMVQEAGEDTYTSAFTVAEVEFVFKRLEENEKSKDALQEIRRAFPRLRFVDLTESVIAESLNLRKAHDLGIFDSIHAATALARDGKIASTDHAFDRVVGLTRITQP